MLANTLWNEWLLCKNDSYYLSAWISLRMRGKKLKPCNASIGHCVKSK